MNRTDRSRRRYLPLLVRIAGFNALLLAIALAATIVILTPNRVSNFRADEEGVLVAIVLAAAIVLNVLLIRRIVGPVQQLTALARRVDLGENAATRVPLPPAASEAADLAVSFNEMLTRLHAERREATSRVLAGQEAERLRIAQELHDQVGQELTAVLLGLARLGARAPEPLDAEIREVQEAVRASLESVRQIAIELRPEALDDLGLESALAVLADRFAERTGLHVEQRIDPDLPPLSADTELVVYRVAQEALTNVARHSGARSAELELGAAPTGQLTLTVTDRGRGLPADYSPRTGTRGMQERAALIKGRLRVEPGPDGVGTRVRLTLPEAT